MKIGFKTLLSIIVGATILSANADAQSEKKILPEPGAPRISMSSDKYATLEQNNSFDNVNPRAVKNFKRSFKEISNEKWSTIDNGYIVSFTLDSVKTLIAYNRKGAWHHTIQYYDGKKLPRNVRDIVKSAYNKYTILNVAEISLDDQPVYMVYIKDQTHFKTIRIYDGETKEVQNYVRG